jgi:hypothetical protein
MRESGGNSTGHNRETTGRANDYPFTTGRSPVPPALTDHTTGRTPVPPALTDHTTGRTPVPPALTDHTTGRSPVPPALTDPDQGPKPGPASPSGGCIEGEQIEPVSLPGQGPPAADS